MEQEALRALLSGSYDLHIHPVPSHVERRLDDFELMEQAAAVGMAGVMIKNHYESTAGRAALLNRRLSHLPTRAYGGVALNWPAGGLNPYAAASALHLGARFVWMPTRDAAHCQSFGDMYGDFFRRPGLSILDERGKLLPAVYEIFDVVKQYDGVLATGHLSPVESEMLCRAGRKASVRMVLTHPEWERTRVPVTVQKELADLGVVVEKVWYNIAEGNCTAAQMAHSIRVVGPERIYLSTDRGQANRESPVEGLSHFLGALWAEGISYSQLEQMVKTVPAELLSRPTSVL